MAKSKIPPQNQKTVLTYLLASCIDWCYNKSEFQNLRSPHDTLLLKMFTGLPPSVWIRWTFWASLQSPPGLRHASPSNAIYYFWLLSLGSSSHWQTLISLEQETLSYPGLLRCCSFYLPSRPHFWTHSLVITSSAMQWHTFFRIPL